MDIKLNGITYPDIEYVSIPKADGDGQAVFRNVENYYTDSDMSKLLNGTLTHINDVNGGIDGTLVYWAFRSSPVLQSINLPNVDIVGLRAFGDCPLLQTISLEKCRETVGEAFAGDTILEIINIPNMCYIRGDYNFHNTSALKKLILGQNQVTGITNRMDWNLSGTNSNGKYYVPSDLLKLYKQQSEWGSYFTRFRSIKQLDKDENDYVLYYIDPLLSNPSGHIKNRALCKFTTSVETVYGLQTYIVGRATDTLTIEAKCPGYLAKSLNISLDSSNTTTVAPDLSDMQVDPDFNGYNLVYMDFCRFNQDLGVYSQSNTGGTYFWSNEDIRHNGVQGGDGRYIISYITLPDLSLMNNPTFVFEANITFKDDSTTDINNVIFSPYRDGGITLNKKRITVWGSSFVIDELNLTGEHHFAVVANKTNAYFYIDGQLYGQMNNNTVYNFFNRTTYMYLDNQGRKEYPFNGRVKQIVICLRDIEDPSVAANCEFLLSNGN